MYFSFTYAFVEVFIFYHQTSTIKHDLTNAKEPPISSLPFSLAASQQPSQATSTTDQTASAWPITSSTSAPDPTPPTARPPPITVPQLSSSTLATESALVPVSDTPRYTNGGGVPNFFSSSSALTKPLDVPQPLPLVFPTADPSTSATSAFAVAVPNGLTPTAPVKDLENPLWEGESKKQNDTSTGTSTLFQGFDSTTSNKATSASVSSGVSDSTTPNPALLAPSISVFGALDKKNGEPTLARQESFAPPASILTASLLLNNAVSKPTISFDAPTTTISTSLFGGSASKPSSQLFGDTPKISTPTSFSFGPSAVPSSDLTKTPAPAPFSFGQFSSDAPKPAGFTGTFPSAQSIPSLETSKSAFGDFSATSGASKPPFGGGGFNFGVKDTEKKSANTPFSFGAAPSTPPPVDNKKRSPFSFGNATSGTPTAPASIGFSFSGESVSGDTGKAFAFSQPATMSQTSGPSTPPKTQEMSMDESPARETQEMNKLPEGGGGFSFTSNAPTTNGSSMSFPFGATSSTSNPFAKTSKPEESKLFGGGGFGQTPTAGSTGFGFGQTSAPDKEPARPSTTGSFNFNAAPTSIAPSFGFGTSGTNNASSVFGQSSGSTPSSPSVFSQPSPFSFGTPLPGPSNPFAFGSSQPASPAGGTNINLPQPSTPGGFGQAQPSSPFGAATASPVSGSLFTIGAPPTSAPAAGGARQIRKLPNRRGGAKR